MDQARLRQERKVFRELLREMRLEAGLRQEDVAERTGEHQSFVSKYESGERRLDVLQLRRVCAALGVPLTTFVERLEDKLRKQIDDSH